MSTVGGKLRRMKRSAVVLLLLWHDGPLTESQVAKELDLNQETARQYLRELAALNVARRLGRFAGWEFVPNAEFPRMSAEIPRSRKMAERGISADERGISADERGISALADSTTTTSINKLNNQEEVVVPNAENLAALKAAGFTATKRVKRLSVQPWVTPAYVQAHKLRLRDGDSPGLALMRMENQEPGAAVPLTDEEERAAFFDGEFAEFIEH